MAHDNHHFVPRFLLDAWSVKADRKISTFFRLPTNGSLKHRRYSPKHCAKLAHLYGLKEHAGDANRIEHYFTKFVDVPGARAYHSIMNDGIENISDQSASDWARFVVGLLVRGPDTVARARNQGIKILKEQFADAPQEYAAIRGDRPEASLLEFVEVHASHVFHDLAPRTLPALVESPSMNEAVLAATWGTVEITATASKFDLLISDKPVIYSGQLEADFFLALPLSPRRLFVAFSDHRIQERLRATSTEELAKRSNASTVAQAMTYVYGAHERHDRFIENHLRRG